MNSERAMPSVSRAAELPHPVAQAPPGDQEQGLHHDPARHLGPAQAAVRPPAPLELTATEERVAALAAAGHTNRQVAAALFLSPRTVEDNLARVYRKLGVSSRAELGAAIARREPATPPS